MQLLHFPVITTKSTILFTAGLYSPRWLPKARLCLLKQQEEEPLYSKFWVKKVTNNKRNNNNVCRSNVPNLQFLSLWDYAIFQGLVQNVANFCTTTKKCNNHIEFCRNCRNIHNPKIFYLGGIDRTYVQLGGWLFRWVADYLMNLWLDGWILLGWDRQDLCTLGWVAVQVGG